MKNKLILMCVALLFGASSANADGCTLNNIVLDGSTTLGTWTSDCNFGNRDGSYAQYYTFDVAEDDVIEIDLKSETDTYLYLLEGANMSGALLKSDDDGGQNLNSKIVTELSAGSYTIEATTYNSGETGDFNLSVIKSSYEIYNFAGDISPYQALEDELETCTGDCPMVYINANVNFSNDRYAWAWEEAIYSPAKKKYEYNFEVYAESDMTADIFMTVDIDSRGTYRSLYYTFGEDQAIGGTGANADEIIPEDECVQNPHPLSVDFSLSPLPFIAIDMSTYTPPVMSKATMVVQNVPDNVQLYMFSYNLTCNTRNWSGSSTRIDEHGSTLLTADRLIDSVEYGFGIEMYTNNTYYEYTLNDNDDDFSNGGVFVEDPTYDGEGIPIFNRTIIATPDDIEISAPENLNFGYTVVPSLYLLLL